MKLTRSSLHRCLQRHGTDRLPEVTGDRNRGGGSILSDGYFHIDIAEVRTASSSPRPAGHQPSAFLAALITTVPCKIRTVLTENGIQFTLPPRYADGPTATYMTHVVDMRCREHGIEHRLTKVLHPWTNG